MVLDLAGRYLEAQIEQLLAVLFERPVQSSSDISLISSVFISIIPRPQGFRLRLRYRRDLRSARHEAGFDGEFVPRLPHCLGGHFLAHARYLEQYSARPDYRYPVVGAPLPEPMRVSAGFAVMLLCGKMRIHTLPPRLMWPVMARLSRLIWRLSIQAASRACKPILAE